MPGITAVALFPNKTERRAVRVVRLPASADWLNNTHKWLNVGLAWERSDAIGPWSRLRVFGLRRSFASLGCNSFEKCRDILIRPIGSGAPFDCIFGAESCIRWLWK